MFFQLEVLFSTEISLYEFLDFPSLLYAYQGQSFNQDSKGPCGPQTHLGQFGTNSNAFEVPYSTNKKMGEHSVMTGL